MSSFPAVPISNVFNTLDYNEIIDGSLSLTEADARYFKISGGFISGFSTFLNNLNVIGTLSINSSPVDLSLISGITAGTPLASKVLSLDALSNINGNINIIGSLTVSIINGAEYKYAGSSMLVSALTSVLEGTCSPSKALIVDSSRNITNINSLTATTLVGTLSSASQPSITSVGTLSTLSMSNGSNASINLTDVSSTVRLLSNTQNATNSTSGAFRTTGGIYCGAGSWFNTTLKVVGTLTGADATLTSLDIKDNSQANNSRIEYQTIGKYVSSSDYSAWTTSIYYQNVTGDTANYISWCPSAKTSTSTGFGMVMNRNGQCSLQDSYANSGSGGLVVGGNIIATLDIYGGVTRYISANGALRSNTTPAVYNAGGGSTRIGLFVQNAIWTSDQVFASSDNRLKRDIEPIELNEARKLLSVQSVSYRLKKDKFDNFTKSIGFIAQDVIENGLDKLVSYVPNNDKNNFPEGYNYGIEYNRVSIYLLELIKDLYKQIDELKKN